MEISKIMVPVIGDSSDDEAIELACEIARKGKGKIFLIHVIKVQRSLPLDAEVETQKRERSFWTE
jgi:nitrogen regulatory protein PII